MIPYKHPRCFCHSSALHSRALREEHCKKQNLRASAAEKGDFLASEPSGWLVLYLSIPQSIGILHVRAVVSILNREGLWHSQQWPLMENLLFFSKLWMLQQTREIWELLGLLPPESPGFSNSNSAGERWMSWSWRTSCDRRLWKQWMLFLARCAGAFHERVNGYIGLPDYLWCMSGARSMGWARIHVVGQFSWTIPKETLKQIRSFSPKSSLFFGTTWHIDMLRKPMGLSYPLGLPQAASAWTYEVVTASECAEEDRELLDDGVIKVYMYIWKNCQFSSNDKFSGFKLLAVKTFELTLWQWIHPSFWRSLTCFLERERERG